MASGGGRNYRRRNKDRNYLVDRTDRCDNHNVNESYDNQSHNQSGGFRNRRGYKSGRSGRGQGHNQRFTNTDNNLWKDDSQNQNQGFPKFADGNSDRPYNWGRENSFGNSLQDFNIKQEYENYRQDYLRSRASNIPSTRPLMNFNEFEQNFYSNYNGRKSYSSADFNGAKNINSRWKDNQINNNSSSNVPAGLPQPKVVRIKQEKLEEAKEKNDEKDASKKKDTKTRNEASKNDNENSSSSNDETAKKIKKLINSKVAAGELDVKTKTSKSVKKTNIPIPEPKIKKEKSSSDESSSSEGDTSESSTKSREDTIKSKSKTNSSQAVTPNTKKSTKSKVEEEEVICLGKLEKKVENLVEEENSISEKSQLECVLCDQDGHTSFFCKMICKNCGDNYHNSTMCLKPPNLSRMLQIYMEFTMSQCCQYDPEKRFSYRNGNVQTELLPGFAPTMISNCKKSSISSFNDYSNEFLASNELKKRKRSSSDVYSLNKSKQILEDSDSSSSSSSLSESISTKKRKKLAKKNLATPTINDINLTSQQLMPMQFNPFMAAALGQMMAFNPNFTSPNYKNFPVKREK